MDLTNIEALINEHGIPSSDDDIIRIVREARGVDVTSVVRPSQEARRTGTIRRNTIHVNRENNRNWIAAHIADAYSNWRASRNWASSAWDHSGGLVSIYRRSSPVGPVGARAHNGNMYIGQFLNLWAGRHGHANEYGVLDFPCPIVLDQNTRVDWEPTQIGTTDHVRIQLVMTTVAPLRLSENARCSQIGMAGVPRYTTALTEGEIASNGWIPIWCADGNLIGAKMPEELDPTGRNLIVVGFNRSSNNYYATLKLVAEALTNIVPRWASAPATTETDRPAGPSEDDIEFVRQIQMVRSFASSMNTRLNDLQSSAELRRSNINTYRISLANEMRRLDDESHELQSLSTGMATRVAERVRSMSGLADEVKALRQVEDAELDSSGSNLILKMRTNFFGMKPSDRLAILIPRITYKIDLMATSFDRGITIECLDNEYAGNGCIHPHLSGTVGGTYSVCWGNAGREPLPEAWARRDWMSFVRLILSFHTQYNSRSPLTTYSSVRANLREAPRSGWITHEELVASDPPTPEVPAHEQTIDLVGAANDIPF